MTRPGRQQIQEATLRGDSAAHGAPGSSPHAGRAGRSSAPDVLIRQYPARQYDRSVLAGKRVVICEDEGITHMQLRRALARAGLNVVASAPNGRDGVESVLAEHPDIVVMDVRMPIMDGLEATRRIMAAQPVCIVLVSAYANEGYEQRAREVGASGYIAKPLASESLAPLLLDALDQFDRSRAR